MPNLSLLRASLSRPITDRCFVPAYFRARGVEACDPTTANCIVRARGIEALFTCSTPYIHPGERIVGSLYDFLASPAEEEKRHALAVLAPYPERDFQHNADHYAPDYVTVLKKGIPGLLADIALSRAAHESEPDRVDFCDAMAITLGALRTRLLNYADAARSLMGTEGYEEADLSEIEKSCRHLADHAPTDFTQALQLVWMIHNCFCAEGRYAMALGRMDQYLYPFFRSDLDSGLIDRETATALLTNVFLKITERRAMMGGDDVVNIAICGVTREGYDATNDLSLCVLHAVRDTNLPGPNLSARITPEMPDAFLDECLKVIGTGLGYPALMNDTVNRVALLRYGYAPADVNDFSMVGCIENFITGAQPPWSDGRFDTPRFLEYIFGEGKPYFTTQPGIFTGKLDEIDSMDTFMSHLERQIAHGIAEYVAGFNAHNTIPDPENHTSPFLSCFCRDCIGRARDINDGGALYPSVHGAALMGIGTMADSLAAIEQVVFLDRAATLSELAQALKDDFVGHERLHRLLLAAPKYGNNHPLPDKYAVWYVRFQSDLFRTYRTRDSGGFYTAIAANTSNIWAGKGLGATPDGRKAGQPLSDAASPTYGKDVSGPTATILSLIKPDYTNCACGTVVNQKYSPAMFEDGNRQRLLALIRTYFAGGGQEIQINATSPEILRDAMEHPEDYQNLVVRVSGFSAHYTKLAREVQLDILRRTQHG